MGVLSFTLVRPCALLCTTLVLLVFFFPEECDAGKKVIPPVKHLFGVGIGYQKVVHYKPVLVFSKSRRVKHRPPGWGWNGGGGSKSSKPKYTPVVVQQHVQKPGKSGYAYGNPSPQHHRRKRKRPHRHHPEREHSYSSSNGRGWGWRQGWRRPHRSYRKGHSGEGGARYYSPQSHSPNHHDSGSGGDSYEYPRNNRHHHHHSGGGIGSNEYPLNYNPHHHHHHHEISDHPSSGGHHDDYGSGGIWGGSAVGGKGAVVYPTHSSNYYGSPYSSMEDFEEDHGGYESEIREQWNKNVPIDPTLSTSTTTVSPTPPLYPFTDHPSNDGSVTNIQKDFLKNHMKNFHQFQEYQESAMNEPRKDKQDESHFAPYLLQPPGPHFSTMDPQSSEAGGKGNAPYDDQYLDDEGRADGGENYDEDYSNDLHKKVLPHQNSQIPSTVQPTLASNTMKTSSSNNFQQIITAKPKTDTKFKPSPRVDEVGIGNSFNKPGFFPTFDQFKQIKMT